MNRSAISRRSFAGSLAATGVLVLLGCGQRAQSEAPAEPADAAAKAPARAMQMIVYRDPSCPCCEKWAAMATEAGYRVSVVDHPDMPGNTMADAERWAAGMRVPAYAMDDETAIKVVDGAVEVVSEGHWKLLTP
jgi:RES domain-containing protein